MKKDIECNLHVYDVTACGLYRGQTSHQHLHLGALLKELKAWAIDSGKSLVETSTYSDSNYVKTSFCMGVEEFEGQYLVTMWNKVQHLKSGIGLVNGAKSPSDVKVNKTKLNENDIPGFPTYFWILPASNKIIGVQLENPSFGVTQLRSYLLGFLINFTSHSVREPGDLSTVVGYSDTSKRNVNGGEHLVNVELHPRFSMEVKKIPGKYDEFIHRSEEVTKLVKDVYVYNSLDSKNSGYIEKIKSMFDGLPPVVKKKLRVQMPVKLTEFEVKKLISKYEENEHDDEFDVGLIFKGKSNQIEWLSGSTQKEKLDLNVEWNSDDNPKILPLLKQLKNNISLIVATEDNIDGDVLNEEAG